MDEKKLGKFEFCGSYRICESAISSDGSVDLAKYDHVDKHWFENNYPKLKDGAKFIEIVPVYETISKNGFEYTPESIKSFNKAAIGSIGYLGHIDEQKRIRGEGYREPVAKYVASRLTKIKDQSGKEVLASSILSYVSNTDAGKRHFTNIQEGIAGNVSVEGDAYARRVGEAQRLVSWDIVRSIDFVNNGTESVRNAGVTSIVKESFKEIDTKQEESNTMDKITLVSLTESAEGREVKSQIEAAVRAELGNLHKAELTKVQESFTALDTKSKELTTELTKVQEQLKKANEEKVELHKKLGIAELRSYRASYFDTLENAEKEKAKAENRDADLRTVAMTKKRIAESFVDQCIVADDADFSKSKNLLKSKIDAEIATVVEMSKEFGGFNQKKEETTVRTVVTESSRQPEADSPLLSIFPGVFGEAKKKAAAK